MTSRRAVIVGGSAVVLGAPTILRAATAKPAALDAICRKYGLPGAVLATRSGDGAKPRIFATGVRISGKSGTVRAGDAWHIGSLTKSMTATMIAKLVDLKFLGWDMTIADTLAYGAPDMHPAYANISIAQLLSHRSGLPANLPLAAFGAYRLDTRDIQAQRRDFAAKSLASPPVGPADATFSYSNLGPVVAATIAEHVTGSSWEQLIQAQLFDPLGLRSAGFGAPGKPGSTDSIWGHRRSTAADNSIPVAPSVFADNPAVMAPAGGVHITAADMLAYLAAHARQSPLLTPESWARLRTPPVSSGQRYAMGLLVQPDGKIWHNGSNTFWYAEAWFDPATRATAFFATNDGYLPACTAAAKAAFLM